MDPTSSAQKDTMNLLLEYGKILWTYFQSTEKYHGPTSSVQKDTIAYFESTERYHGPTFRVREDAMDIL